MPEHIIKELQQMYSLIDLTSLEATDTTSKILTIAQKSKTLFTDSDAVLFPAAICVYPVFVSSLRNELKDTPIKTASVACGFPSGQTPLEIKLEEVNFLMHTDVDEVDMVISRGKFLEKDYDYVANEIAQVRKICKDKTLKVIIESGELETPENIRKATQIAISSGADFVKTSTGKSKVSATPEAVQAICDGIKSHFVKTGKKVGIKVSGGVTDVSIAKSYLTQIEKSLGKDWIKSSHCRIGASSLAHKILNKLSEIQGNPLIYNYF